MDSAIPVRELATALLIGALVGIEREKRKAAGPATAGLRTFILVAEAGAVAAWLAMRLENAWVFVAAGAAVAALVIAGYAAASRAHPDADLGLTTEIAALVVFLLGGTAVFGEPGLAVALAIVTSAVLAFKQPLHGAVERLGMDDIFAGLKLLIATFIVLPVLPNRPVDPWQALNPYEMWLLVILISALSLVGYVATRWLGPGRGSVVTGLAGGLVSSTAVTLAFARESREEGRRAGAVDELAAGLVLAWSIMFVRVLVAVAVVNRTLLAPLLAPMLAMAGAGAVTALVYYRRAATAKRAATSQQVPLQNPFSLVSAIRFALIFAVVLLAVKLTEVYFPGRGFLAVAALAGLTDVDAITLSMAEWSRHGGDARTAVQAIAVAAVSNTAVKTGLAAVLGSPALRARALVAAAVIALAAFAALALA